MDIFIRIMKIPKVPASLIVEYTGSLRTAKIMHKYIYDTVYAKVVPNKILLYGQVQSGKTKNMIDFIYLNFVMKQHYFIQKDTGININLSGKIYIMKVNILFMVIWRLVQCHVKI